MTMRVDDNAAYGGWCQRCERRHQLPTEPARPWARELLGQLEGAGCLDFELPPHRRSSALRVDVLHESAGQMFGVCLAHDATAAPVVLKAFSGQYEGIWVVPGWVGPTADVDARGQLVEHQFNRENDIKALHHASLKAATEAERRRAWHQKRKASQRLMRDIHAAYVLRNAHGDTASLLEACVPRERMPSGTGECCAPKLLQACYRRGLRPLALAEFWFGRPNTHERQHGQWVGACLDKCEPLLGFMLCGASDD